MFSYDASGLLSFSGYHAASERQLQGVFSVGDGAFNQSIVITNQYGNMTGFGVISSNDDGTTVQDSVGVLPNTGEWYQVTMTRDGNNVKLYVDGTLVKTIPASGKTAKLGSIPRAEIAKILRQYYSGRVDDVRVYRRALNDSEVQGLLSGQEPMTASLNLTSDFFYDGSGKLLFIGAGFIQGTGIYVGLGGRILVSSEQRLWLWWKLDEGTGSTAYDSSFYNHPGTVLNMEPGDWTTGAPLINMINSSALQFDGQNESVVGNLMDLGDVEGFSLSIWVLADEMPSA